MLNIPLAKKINYTELDANKGVFSIEPLYPGYGLTLSNALRRVLLSSLSGAAIEAIKIEGVDHEFSTLDWLKEDIVDVILNIKQIRLHVSDEILTQAQETGEPIKLTMEVKGEKDVTAGDFTKMAGVEVVNPDLKIATLTDKAANFVMEAYVGYGLGYSPTEARAEREKEVGVIDVDAIYTPIKRVGYDIENVRVGDMTNWDKIKLTIETDSTMTCQDAFDQAVKILVDQFSALDQNVQATEEEAVETEEKTK